MRVLLNAISIKEGGSLVVLHNLLHHMAVQRPDIQWFIAANPSVRIELGVMVEVGDVDDCAGVIDWYIRGLSRAAKLHRVDVILSLTNYLPLGSTPCPTVLLEQHAGHFSNVYDRLQMARCGFLGKCAWRLKTMWVERSVRRATILTVQTAALADAIARQTGRLRDSIRVVPHGPGVVAPDRTHETAPRPGPLRIGYITKWGVQKNFDVLFRAVARLRATGIDFRLVLTLDDRLPESRQTLDGAGTIGITDIIENHGQVEAAVAAALYDKLDIFVFPSLVESFGFPIVEALARGLPLLIADTESNREVAGSAASAFAPDDDTALASLLARLIAEPAVLRQAAAAAAARGRDFSWQTCAARTLALLDEARCLGRLP